MLNFPHIQETTIGRVGQDTFHAYARLDYLPSEATGGTMPSMDLVKKQYMTLMGYNPSDPLKNKQVCVQCKKHGYMCPGHPIRIELWFDYLNPFHARPMSRLFRAFCRNCGHVVRPPTTMAERDLGLFVGGLTKEDHKLHKGCACFAQTKATLYELDSESPFKRKRFVADSLATMRGFLDRLDKDDLALFGLSKDNVSRLFSREILLLPLSLQPVDPYLHRQQHMPKHMNLIRFLQENAGKTLGAKELGIFYGLVAKLMIADTDDGLSCASMCRGKEGIMRMSVKKRSTDTARAVLTPDNCKETPGEMLGGMGILKCPRKICETVKRLYIVSPHNIALLQSQVGTYVTHIIRNGVPVRLAKVGLPVGQPTGQPIGQHGRLQLGDQVLVSLRNGDVVFVNRFPTLHKASYTAYKTAICDKNAFKFPNVNAVGHNADFDGDEGNIYVTRDLAGRIETEFCFVNRQVIGDKSGEPGAGIVYNGIIGAFLLSQVDHLPDKLFKKLAKITGQHPAYWQAKATLLGIPAQSGRLIWSMLLPPGLTYVNKDVVIEDGMFLRGKLKKADVNDKLVHALFLADRYYRYDTTSGKPSRPDEGYTCSFIDRGYKLASLYASTCGVTIGSDEYVNHLAFDDTMIPAVNMTGRMLLQEVDKHVALVEAQKATKTESSRRKLEAQILSVVGSLSVLTEEKVRAFLTARKNATGVGNTADISYLSGARGSIGNVATAIAPIGQLYIDDQRLASNTRLTPYSALGSTLIEDNGFIMGSYAGGLSPKECVQGMITGRLSACNVYFNTPIAGEASRQLGTILGGITIRDDFSVRGRSGEILAPLYAFGASTKFTSKKACPLGDQQMCFDMRKVFDQFLQ